MSSITAPVIELVANAIIRASTEFSSEHLDILRNYIAKESNSTARWVLEKVIENAEIAIEHRMPLCDDTGIPHLFLEMGHKQKLSAELLFNIQNGVAEGLRKLPGRPMSVLGNGTERLEQSRGLSEDPGAILPAPIFVKLVDKDLLRLHVLLQGGGPEIRGRTHRVFHRHSLSVIMDEIMQWAIEGAAQLGCTPCVPAIGIGRSHYEASTLMLEALAKADFSMQSKMEQEFTTKLNQSGIGPLGLGSTTTALATFIKIGPQRASGVRIVCLRLGCCVEPRHASVLL